MIGKSVSHYRVTKKLGEGGMGEVYLAEDTSLHRQVALKFLPPHLQQDGLVRKRFLREAESATREPTTFTFYARTGPADVCATLHSQRH